MEDSERRKRRHYAREIERREQERRGKERERREREKRRRQLECLCGRTGI